MSGLLTVQQVDPWLQFNPYVVTGYRPRMSPRAALRSFFAWHNESFNVWSHTAAAFFTLYLAVLPPTDDSAVSAAAPLQLQRQRPGGEGALLNASPATVFRGTCLVFLAIFVCSAAYHLFMPCTTSEGAYRRLLNCDVLGVVTSITGTAWCFLYRGNACGSGWSSHVGAVALLLSYVAVLYSVLFAVPCGAMGRAKAIGFHCALRLSILLWMELPKVQVQGYHQALNYHAVSYLFIIVGGAVNALRFPEKQLRHVLQNSLSSLSSSSSSSSSALAATTRRTTAATLSVISRCLTRFWRWFGMYVVSGAEIDYAWNSHNLWHYCVIMSATSTLLGCYYDLAEFELARC
ncbi:adiponectin receptor [Trypanosoma grayi]|uniref:adiponectin receptor n=1 Tax=Trypanosoma grayi TaxID=71804 RepID=UPI0004F49FAD|nr:adiponectin receptor [Trypanosoma grayi]KEG09869.1 adiponectin receptor [Trypanosoma grayi]